MIKVPCSGGHKHYTRRAYLAELIAKYTYDEPPEYFGGLRMPRVPNSDRPKFHFPRKREETVGG